MSIKGKIACAGVLPLFAVLAGCSADSDQPRGEEPGADWTEGTALRKAPLSYEEYREKARQTVDGRELFIVEGDMIFDREEALRSYYDQLYLSPEEKSVIKLVNNARDARPHATSIKYCFSAGWGLTTTYTAPTLPTVKKNIQDAMKSWESIADVKFVYMSNLDGGGCNTGGTNPGVDFVITHWNNTFASGPFPDLKWLNQQLLVGKVTTTNPNGIEYLLALHELGHVLGFMHENNNSGASPSCPEGLAHENLTAFDPASVMLYTDCPNSFINNTPLSGLDATGARMVYGPTSSNSLYIVQSDSLWRADDQDGTYKKINNSNWANSTSTAFLGGYVYVIQDDSLWRVDPKTGAFKALGVASWPGATTMAAVNGTLYITQDDALWKITDLTTGAYVRVGAGDWTDATSMAALGSSLYIVQNSTLLKVDPTTGTWTRLGRAGDWAGPTMMAVVGRTPNLYIIQNATLYRITDLSTGTWVQVGLRNDWADTTSMTSLDDMLYMIQDSRLWRTVPSSGAYTSLGLGWGGPTVMTAVP